jgi:hypothetical protein
MKDTEMIMLEQAITQAEDGQSTAKVHPENTMISRQKKRTTLNAKKVILHFLKIISVK